MKKSYVSAILATLFCVHAWAGNIEVKTVRVTTPYSIMSPLSLDSVDASGNDFNADAQLMGCIPNPNVWRQADITTTDAIAPVSAPSVRVAGFTFDNCRFAQVKFEVSGTDSKEVYLDGIKTEGTTALVPGRHEVAVKFLTKPEARDTLKIAINTEQEQWLTINAEGKRPYTLHDVTDGEHPYSVSLSPSGRFLQMSLYTTYPDGSTQYETRLIDLKTNKCVDRPTDFLTWSKKQDLYIRERKGNDMSSTLQWIDPCTGDVVKEAPYMAGIAFSELLPDEESVLYYQSVTTPKEDADIYETISPDDRQPGYRDRFNLALFNLKSGIVRPLTQGQHRVWASASHDGSKLLFSVSEERLTARPTTVTSFILMDVNTGKVDTLVNHGEFLESAIFSPDDTQLLFKGSPEAFNNIGRTTEAIPSTIQTELYVMDIATREVRSITRDFNPNVGSVDWCKADGMIYALCENADRHDIFRIDPKTLRYTLLPLSENYITRFDIAQDKPVLTYYGQSESNADRVYVVNLKNNKETLILDEHATRLKDVELTTCTDWNFTSSRGDTITGRYYLPTHFDPSRKYPMIVYYYGGCSPTGRYMESRYPFHAYANLGYVVYVVQPSGATGFGQEFASRHVNAYGDWTADDIIEGTRQFWREHEFVDSCHVGCMGASYGGFMTMYLQTRTDIFRAAISHAGISNPASYWGFGYWGYSYSETSAAGSYPWNNPELYTDHAPLFHADKVNTPILFIHGDADTNVPYMESVQMFTALKLLGKETALVAVSGENHHISNYQKRYKWQNTIWAWFSKYLQEDPTWWNALYPKKNL